MTAQLALSGLESDLQERFWKFHLDNPQVYILFEKFTLQLIARGFKHYSADAVMHRVRWETSVETTGDLWKINNDHTAYYSRRFMANHPEYSGFFRTRTTK